MQKFFFLVLLVLFFSGAAVALCGNSVCESTAGENKCTCPVDCDSCSGAVSGRLCQFYQCDPTNTVCQAITTYPCCGNNACEIGESFANCPIDCAPKIIAVSTVDFDEEKSYMRGDSVVFKALVTGDGVRARQSNVSIAGIFGQITLFDDGNHFDGNTNDAVYANRWIVGGNIAKDTYDLTITAEKLGAYGSKNIRLTVDPTLNFSVSLNSERILLGEIISIKGNVKKRGSPLEQKVSFSAFDEKGKQISGFFQSVFSNAKGDFYFDYHTSLIEPIGEWTIKAETLDTFGNRGYFEKKIKVGSAESAEFLDLGFLVPPQTVESIFERGDEIKILADLKFQEKAVESATVTAKLAESFDIPLSEFVPGKYNGKFEVPLDFPLGVVELKGIAFKEIGKTKYSGSAVSKLIIKEAPIKIEVSEPTINVFALGETINIVVSLKYPSNAPAAGIDLNAVASDGRKVSFKEIRLGVYQGSLPVLSSNIKGLNLSINAVDGFKNKGSKELPFEILGTKSFYFYFLSDPLIVVLVILVVIVLFGLFVFLFSIRRHMGALEKRRRELTGLREELQENYFSRATIDRKEYYNLMSQYTDELERINAAIESLGRGKKPPKGLLKKLVKPEQQQTLLDSEAEEKPLELFKVDVALEKEPEKQKKGFLSFFKKSKGGKK